MTVSRLVDDEVRPFGAAARAAAPGEKHVGLQIVRLQEILDHAEIFLVAAGKAAASHTNDDLAFHKRLQLCSGIKVDSSKQVENGYGEQPGPYSIFFYRIYNLLLFPDFSSRIRKKRLKTNDYFYPATVFALYSFQDTK